MDEEKTARIIHLVRLLESGRSVEWDTVWKLVEGFPRWTQLINLLCEPHQRVPYSVPFFEAQGACVSDGVRKQLRANFKPYAILFQRSIAPEERIAQLQKIGVDVSAFCQQCLHDPTPEVVQAATELWEVYQAQNPARKLPGLLSRLFKR